MSNETLFYVLGLSLVAIALILSFAGMRFKKFPGSSPLMIAVTAAVALLVVATSVFAWRNGEDEQAHKEAELAEAAEHSAEQGETVEEDEEQGSDAAPATETASAAEGAELFNSQGCSGCHTLAAAEGSSGTTGPDLDGALQGESPEFIRTSIIDPNDDIAQGYPPDVMPQNYETQMSPEELDALVQYLVESTKNSSQ